MLLFFFLFTICQLVVFFTIHFCFDFCFCCFFLCDAYSLIHHACILVVCRECTYTIGLYKSTRERDGRNRLSVSKNMAGNAEGRRRINTRKATTLSSYCCVDLTWPFLRFPTEIDKEYQTSGGRVFFPHHFFQIPVCCCCNIMYVLGWVHILMMSQQNSPTNRRATNRAPGWWKNGVFFHASPV